MVKPGGTSAMLGQWRVLIKQADESARAGRLDEALLLLSRPETRDHKQAIQSRARIVRDLIQRAKRRGQADDTAGALCDLDLADQHGAAPDVLAEVRLALAERIADEIRAILEAGDPGRALDRIDGLAKRHVSGPALRRLREAAEAWNQALEDGRRGEFGQARASFDRASRMLHGASAEALAASRRDLDARQELAQPRIERLYRSLGARPEWGEILAAAESVIEAIPEHAAARTARGRAWQQIAALNPSASLPGRNPTAARAVGIGLDLQAPNASAARPVPELVIRDEQAQPEHEAAVRFLDDAAVAARGGVGAPRQAEGPRGRSLLWVDAVGGYLLCLDGETVIGRAGHDSQADVPILGDLSRRHATLVRQGDSYIVKAHHPTFVNGRQVVGTAPLRDRDVLRMGPSVEMLFRQPTPVSATARLEILSRHRLPLAVEGVILMAETCIIGAPATAHIPSLALEQPVVLFRQSGSLWCRFPSAFEVDGAPRQGRAELSARSNVRGDQFSFSLEPIAVHAASA